LIRGFFEFVAKAVCVVVSCLLGLMVIGIMVGGGNKPNQQETAQAAPVAEKPKKVEAQKEALKMAAKPQPEPEDMSASRVTYKQAETLCRQR
jgi:hypothetical protein